MRTSRAGSLWALWTALVLLMSAGVRPAYAQGQLSTATLTGRVMDQTGAVIPGAHAELQRNAGGVPLAATTNESGYYRFSLLRPDIYTLRVTKEGFSEAVISAVTLQVDQTASVDVTLRPGKVVQEVTVTASSVALETQTSSLGRVVPQRITGQLPLILRDPTQLVNLVPGVTSDLRIQGGGGASNNRDGLSFQGRMDFTINGGVREHAEAMVDGIDVTLIAGGFPSLPVVVSSDFTQEFKVQTTNLSAEFGHGAGALNIVTKSGTNALHGTVYEFLQNDNLNAQDLFSNSRNQAKPELKRNQYGYAVGGPIIKNKTFFFTDFEQMRQRRFLPVYTRVPTNAEESGNFQNLYLADGRPLTIYNPFDTFVNAAGKVQRRPFANNTIPASMITPFGQKILSFYPQPNNPGLIGTGGVPTQTGNYSLAAGGPINFDKLDVKIDHNLGASHRFMGRWSRTVFRAPMIDFFNNPATPDSLSNRDETQTGNNIVFSWTWTAKPTLVITQAANWVRFTHFSRNDSQGFDVASLGGPFADGRIAAYTNLYGGGTAFPFINPGGYAPLGNNNPGDNFRNNFSNYSYQFGLVKVAGTHTLKAGFQAHFRQGGENKLFGNAGAYSFGNFTRGPDPFTPTANSGNAVADLLLGLVSGGNLTTGYTTYLINHYFAWYFQDDWRVTPKLTLNLGARYDVSTPFTDRFRHVPYFDINVPNPVGAQSGPNTGGVSLNQYFQNLVGRPLQGAVVFANSPQAHGPGISPIDWSNFAPRLGFAYQVSNKLVMRGGFSRLYFVSLTTQNSTGTGSGTLQSTTNILATVNGYTPNVTLNNPFPAGFTTPIFDSQGLMSLVGSSFSGGFTGATTPYQWQWNFGFQYQMPANSLLSVGYVGGRSHRLVCPIGNCTDQIAVQDIQKWGSQVNQSVPNPFYGIVTDLTKPLSTATVQRGQLLKQWPEFSSVQAWVPSTQGPNGDNFRSAFEALEVGWQKSYSHGLSVLLAYTFSKNLTNSDSFESGYLGPTVGYQNLLNFDAERSLSAEDVTHRLVIGHVFDLPFGRKRTLGKNWNPVLDAVAGGWQFAGSTTLQSGFPLPISVAGLQTGAFGGGARPNVNPGVNACLDTGRSRGDKILQYLNPNAFLVPPAYTFGNASRLLPNCRSDGVKNFDMSFIKFFPIKERVNLEFRSEFFNIFNRPQLSPPNSTFNGGGYGRITAQANLPRVIQFALKVNF